MDTKELIRLMRTRDDSRNGWTDEQLIVAAAAELERLAGIVERLPKHRTKDDAWVRAFTPVWVNVGIPDVKYADGRVVPGETPPWACDEWEFGGNPFVVWGGPYHDAIPVEDCYSTKEAAELARQQDATGR